MDVSANAENIFYSEILLTPSRFRYNISFQQRLKGVFIVKLSSEELKKKAETALRTSLEKVPFVKIKNIKKDTGKDGKKPDLLVKVKLSSGEQYIIGEIKTSGQPRLARVAVNQLLRYLDMFPGSYGVFMAPYISPEAAEVCLKENIGYLDFSGNCFLCFDQVYIENRGAPNLFAKRRDLRSLYSPKAERVLRVLLNNPKRIWKVKDLANEAGVSLGQVSNVKKLLDDREWLKIESDGFSLDQPEKLISEWAENYRFRKNQVWDFYSMKDIPEIEDALANLCRRKGVKYALTGFSGAARLAPTVRYKRAFVYIEESQEAIASQLDLKKVTSGANVTLLTPYDEGVFYKDLEIDGMSVASPVQIYLDLIGFRGRGEEAANAILEEIIQPTW